MMRAFVAAAIVSAAAIAPAQAQSWPARPVTLVVPYAAGGPVDTIARILAARMSETLGQQIIIENVGGAGGMTGARARRQGAARRLYAAAVGQRGARHQPDALQAAALQRRSPTSSTW